MKSLLFFLVFFGIAFIAWRVASSSEGFQDTTPDGADPGLTIPLISPRYQTLTKGAVMPFTEPSTTLLSPPPGQIASINALPPEDPALQKVDLPRIQYAYALVSGLFKGDTAGGLQKLGDPSVQLPLSTARSDMGRLKDEQDVLTKNPGLQSTLTQDDVDAIQANVAYLQKKWRLSVNARSGAPSPMPPHEGFSDMGTRGIYGWFRSFFGGNQEGFIPGIICTVEQNCSANEYCYRTTVGGEGICKALESVNGSCLIAGVAACRKGLICNNVDRCDSVPCTTNPDCPIDYRCDSGKCIEVLLDTACSDATGPYCGMGQTCSSGKCIKRTAPITPSSLGGSCGSSSDCGSGLTCGSSGSCISSGSPSPGSPSKKCDLTLADLQGLELKINIEVIRLKASGTTDANTQSRISVLSALDQNMVDLISSVKYSGRDICTVPLTKADIAAFLPAISNPNSAIPDLLKDWGLQSVLSSLFPKYNMGDLSGSSVAKALFDKYMKDMTNNLSWDVGFSYKGQAEQDIAANNASAMRDARYAVDNTGAPTASNSDIAANAGAASSSPYRGLFNSVITSVTGQEPTTLNVNMGPTTTAESSNSADASPLDWKARSTQICNQINARGMNSYDFGCMTASDNVSENFSWRGYTRMVCTRLATVYDPSIPELCGCPPPSWIGWRP